MKRLVAALAVAVLSGCAGTDDRSPGVSASTDPFLEPQGAEATGELLEVGDGEAFDTGWRYGVYPREGGWCAQLEVTGVVTSRCDDVLPEGDAVFGSIGRTTSEVSGATVFDGIVTRDVATVWLILGPAARIPATRMELTDAGLEQQAFVGVVPASEAATHLLAVALSGEPLETHDLR